MKLRRRCAAITLAAAAGLAMSQSAIAQQDAQKIDDRIFETNVTRDLNMSSGEPEIAIDPTDPNHLVIMEFALGSKKVPAWSLNPVLDATADNFDDANINIGRLMLSYDGGATWTPRAAPAYDPTILPHKGGGDPMLDFGPDGSVYVANGNGRPPKSGHVELMGATLRNVGIWMAGSTDGGKTFANPQPITTPRDRPFLKVDKTTGTVYTASTGPYNPKTKEYNTPGPDAPYDRWLQAWKPHLAGHSLPRRFGGPDFSAAGGNTMTAANGVIASAFFIDGPEPPGRASVVVPIPASYRHPVPVPESLRPLIKNGVTTCSTQAPCVFFETSTDEGQTWSRHQVPVSKPISGMWMNVAGDPGLPGRYAVSMLDRDGGFTVMVTSDSGETWTETRIPETAQGRDFKQWMDYGPSGVLGMIWKKERSDVSTPAPAGARTGGLMMSWGAAFDVYAAISCDGGFTWLPPVRVNGVTSPSGPNGFDDLSYVALDRNYAHLVWGDRRDITKVKNAPSGIGGIQVYYGRVPFSVASHGAPCGRQFP